MNTEELEAALNGGCGTVVTEAETALIWGAAKAHLELIKDKEPFDRMLWAHGEYCKVVTGCPIKRNQAIDSLLFHLGNCIPKIKQIIGEQNGEQSI